MAEKASEGTSTTFDEQNEVDDELQEELSTTDLHAIEQVLGWAFGSLEGD